jgi:hypothetical protein
MTRDHAVVYNWFEWFKLGWWSQWCSVLCTWLVFELESILGYRCLKALLFNGGWNMSWTVMVGSSHCGWMKRSAIGVKSDQTRLLTSRLTALACLTASLFFDALW